MCSAAATLGLTTSQFAMTKVLGTLPSVWWHNQEKKAVWWEQLSEMFTVSKIKRKRKTYLLWEIETLAILVGCLLKLRTPSVKHQTTIPQMEPLSTTTKDLIRYKQTQLNIREIEISSKSLVTNKVIPWIEHQIYQGMKTEPHPKPKP